MKTSRFLSISRPAHFHCSSISPISRGLDGASVGRKRFSSGPRQRKCSLSVCPETVRSQASGPLLRVSPHRRETSRDILHQGGSGSSRLDQADKTAACILERGHKRSR